MGVTFLRDKLSQLANKSSALQVSNLFVSEMTDEGAPVLL